MTDLNSVQMVTRADFGGVLTGSYQALNGTGFSDDVKIMQIYNGNTTTGIDISLDGTTPHFVVPPSGTLIVDFQTNHSNHSTGAGTLYAHKGQIIYGKTLANPTYLFISGYR